MPYQYFYDSEQFDSIEDVEKFMDGPKGPFEYTPAEATFDADDFGEAVAPQVYALLVNLGATRMRATYDGGNDEGFAHADAFWFGEKNQTCEEVARLLSTPEVMGQLREAAAKVQWGEWFAKAETADAAKMALDLLADELAQVLLGEGYGTGEYELYGALVADLRTCEIMDDPSALPPNGGLGG
jgi:hypothetical protein